LTLISWHIELNDSIELDICLKKIVSNKWLWTVSLKNIVLAANAFFISVTSFNTFLNEFLYLSLGTYSSKKYTNMLLKSLKYALKKKCPLNLG